MVRIFLLGPFEVERDGRVIPAGEWARPKDRALLKLLALDRGHLVPQDRLLEALWPHLASTAAANSLHVAVSRLRKLIAPTSQDLVPPAHLVRREGAGYSLAADSVVWIDLEEFRRLLGQAREFRRRGAWSPATQTYRAAEALYRGDLFEDDPYDDWAVQPREHLRELYLALLEELADCLIHVGTPTEAIEICERGLVRDRTREALYVQLMHAHYDAGHLAEALRAYERCREALVDELGVDPGPAVRAAHDRLLRDDVSSSSPAQLVPLQPTPGVPAVPETGPLRSALVTRVSGQDQLPCVGREIELAWLLSHLDAAQAGRGRLALVTGEPGIGKSRLLAEFGQLAADRGVRVLTARCYEMERDLPYAPLADSLSSILLERVDPPEVMAAVGEWGPHLASIIPSLRDLLPDLPSLQPLRPDAERSALVAGLTHLMLAIGHRRPLALLLDDLQWSDASTLQWLHYFARRLTREPVLVLGTYRAGEIESDHALQRLLDSLAGHPASPDLLELNCLTPDHIASLLPAVSGSTERAQTVAAWLYRETEGLPLFLIETLRTLVETGVLREGASGTWTELKRLVLTDDSQKEASRSEHRLPLPASLRDAILWRLRRLNEDERRILAAAAVVGRDVDTGSLAQVAGLDANIVLDGVESLTARQFLRPADGGSSLDFRHDVIREVVYRDLSADRRRALHARTGESIESRVAGYPRLRRELAGELAHHWWQAERWTPAFQASLLAGDHAWDASAPREALTHYRRAAEAAERIPVSIDQRERAGLLERLGRAHADLGETEPAVSHFQSLRDLARDLGDRLLEGRILVALANVHFYRHDFDRAEPLITEALLLSEQLANPEPRAGTLVCAAGVALAQGRTDDAERHCQDVLALLATLSPAATSDESSAVRPDVATERALGVDLPKESPGLAAARLNALGFLGLLWELQGDHERAMPVIESSIRLGDELHNLFLTGRSRFALGMSLGNRGRYEDALATLTEALRLAEESGERYFLPRLPNTIGWIYSELGDLAQAEDWNRRSIALALETGWPEAEANARVNLAIDALRLGDHTSAREEFERATALIERDNWFTWRYRIRLMLGLGELALLDGLPGQTLTYARQALAHAEASNSRKHIGRAWLLTARALLAASTPTSGANPHGDRDRSFSDAANSQAAEAIPCLERARSLAVATGNPPLLWNTCAELARLHTRLHQDVEAAACWSEAQQAVNAVASGIQDTTLRRSLLTSLPVQPILASR
jgi:DNA-binding SARP family transcriptional activator